MSDLETAIDIAHAAGRVLVAGFAGGPATLFGRRHGAATKTGEFDLVTEFDRGSEALLVERLTQAFPGDAVIAEEGTRKDGAGARWLVDPLDGTTNFVHGLPFFCVALARERDGQVDLAV